MASGRVVQLDAVLRRGYRILAHAVIQENRSNVGSEMSYDLMPTPGLTGQEKREVAHGLRKLADALDWAAEIDDDLKEL